jgi:HAD superfamily hydrolase (TIGR01490 family)
MAAEAAAFFDLDRTLMEGSSAFQFGRAAYKAGLMSRRRLVADAIANLRFRLRGATDEDTNQLRDRISKSLAGVRVRDLERLGASVLAGVLPRIYPEVLAIAHRHQDEGRRVYIVTAAAGDLAEMLARVLALDGGIGSQFSGVLDGVYTGRPEGLFIYGAGKATAIEQLARERNLDLAASYAYSDSVSDLPMLRAVGHPVVVNPDRELATLARAEGWDVLRLDHLSRRLKGAALLVGAAAAGGAGTAALAARTRQHRPAVRGRATRHALAERVPRAPRRLLLPVRGRRPWT